VRTINVGTLVAAPGEKIKGRVVVLETPVSTLTLPVVIINGREPGPGLVLFAGIHGSEYPPIEAASRLGGLLTPDRLRGSVVILPLINVPGFEACEVNLMPLDGLNLNRLFPGDPHGSPSSKLVHFLFETVRRVGTHMIDMHGGDLTEHLEPFTIYHETGALDVDRQSEKMAYLYDTPRVWAMKAPFGHMGTSFAEISKIGIPAIAGEAGFLGTCRENEVEIHLRGVSNIMKFLGMTEGAPERLHEGRQELFRRDFILRVRRGGIFEPKVGPSVHVTEGEYLGRIKTLEGDTLEEVRSPADGVIRTLFPRRVVQAGSIVYRGWIREPSARTS
jgi:predicted deacylase